MFVIARRNDEQIAFDDGSNEVTMTLHLIERAIRFSFEGPTRVQMAKEGTVYSFMFGENRIEVHIVQVHKLKVRIGIDAPNSVKVRIINGRRQDGTESLGGSDEERGTEHSERTDSARSSGNSHNSDQAGSVRDCVATSANTCSDKANCDKHSGINRTQHEGEARRSVRLPAGIPIAG